MKKWLFLSLLIMSAAALSLSVRIKDIASFRGARDNQLFGIGVVVGLDGTGDSGSINSSLIANMATRFGISIDPKDIKSRNTAIVMVFADIPPFYKEGMRLDVSVASIGDAKSLLDGYLIQTPLYGADGKVYAVAQGPLTLGGEDVKGSSNLQKRYKVVGYIPGGAIVEEEIPMELAEATNTVTLLLNNPDITTAARVADAVNNKFGMKLAKALDPSAIRIKIPDAFKDDLISFLAVVEDIDVVPDMPARVIINERTGTIVFGGDVKIADFTLSYGNFSITVSNGKIDKDEATVGNLVAALKSLGATPQDIIAILQTLHKSGVLMATLVVM